MQSFGIYTLANDAVFDQLVALLNSIEQNVSKEIPICVIPYNNKLDLVKQELKTRANVTLFENWDAIKIWDEFVNQVWEAHPREKESKISRPGWYKGFVHRKFAAYHGDFDRFVFYDADSLAMKPIDDIIQRLDNYDLVINDWEHAKPRNATEVNLDLIEKAMNLQESDLRPKLHCDSFFGSKKLLFGTEQLNALKQRLIEQREIEWIKPSSFWSSSGLFTYMTLHGDIPMFNFTLSPNGAEKTGNCANADPFVNIDNVLFNQDGLKPIHRIHYMSYSSADFARLCKGEDVNILYKEEFLHYRFLKQPELKPKRLVPANFVVKTNRSIQKAVSKIKRVIG